MNVDADDSNVPEMRHINATKYKAMMVSLSRMLPLYADSLSNALRLQLEDQS
jgi:hypothetical protein